jgi:oleate hydratase
MAAGDGLTVRGITIEHGGQTRLVTLDDGDLVLVTNGSMTANSRPASTIHIPSSAPA